MVDRAGYGLSTYGNYAYGLDGVTQAAASTVITASVVAAASVRVRAGASTIITVSATASTGQRVREASATIATAASVSSASQRVRTSSATVSAALAICPEYVSACNRRC
jgi:DNA-binding PucR family transcriptional regulator